MTLLPSAAVPPEAGKRSYTYALSLSTADPNHTTKVDAVEIVKKVA